MPAKPQAGVPSTKEDYWAIVHRRFWWITLPFFLCWLGVWTISWFLPAKYESEALILVEQQKVPESYVASNVTVDLQDRLQSMTQQILSRTRLQTTIDRFHLYRPQKGRGGFFQPTDPIDEMRQDIKIDLVRSPERGGLTAFKIYYSAGSPELAQQVNSELTSLFIDENLKAQQQQSESTTAFLNDQLESARASLQEQEARVRAFKTAHFGALPTQMQSNVQILSGLQAQLETSQRDLESAKQQKLYLESLQQYESRRAALDGGSSDGSSAHASENDLVALRRELAAARAKYTDDYPDMVTLQERISAEEKLEKQSEDAASSPPKADTTSKDAGAGEAANTHALTTPSLFQIQSQIKAVTFEIATYQQQAKELGSKISDYQARLNLTPQTEQELTDISLGYEESVSNYNSLLQKQMQSQLATSLEQRQQGEQFSILDPPSLPTKPSSPNHVKMSLYGLILGAALGIGFAVLLEVTQERVWHAKSLEGIVPARLLVALPHLSTPSEDQFRGVVRLAKICATSAMAVLIVAGNLYAFLKG
jgi:succinoglycan biosynthesis transport protein ExoP